MKHAGVSLILVAVMLLAVGVIAEAQRAGKIPWIGYLAGSGSGPSPAFIQGLHNLGYIEGKNIGIVFRTAEGKTERFSDLAAELVRLKVDVIVTNVTSGALAAKKATSTIPIVMTTSTDPVATGLIASFARPGGNVTGLSSVTRELGGKHLELLKEIAPKLTRAAILSPGAPSDVLYVKDVEISARSLLVNLITLVVRGSDEIEDAFRVMTKEQANGLLMRLPPAMYGAHFKRVAELTMKNRLPSISTTSSWADAGGLISYGADANIMERRAATYVDKILKGTKPSDLPVEAPMKFEFIVNLKAAKQIGLTIPPNVLVRADRVIK